MTAKLRGAVYVVATAVGALLVVSGWMSSDQVDAWVKVVDSIAGLLVVAAPLLALNNLTPDAPEDSGTSEDETGA